MADNHSNCADSALAVGNSFASPSLAMSASAPERFSRCNHSMTLTLESAGEAGAGELLQEKEFNHDQ